MHFNMTIIHTLRLILAGTLIFILGGCSFSESSKSFSKSSKSISKSISSPSEWSSESSSPDKEKKYQEDVADYTAAFVRSSDENLNLESFQHGIAEIAAKAGIANWENNPLTYRGIGKGLRKAKVKGVEYETYQKNLGGGDYGKMNDIQKGYESKD